MTKTPNQIPARERVIVALDVPDRNALTTLLDRLDGRPAFYKVGLELFVAEGERAIELVRARGGRVFLDLKLHDIPNTAAGGIRAVAELAPTFITIHSSGGRDMLKAVVEEAGAQAAKHGVPRAKLLGVTVLTSLDRSDLEATGIHADPSDQVLRLAALARECGLDGVICSPLEITALRKQCGPDFVLMVPGIRPAGSAANDQKRVMTPRQAVDLGATNLVVSRPIYQAADPRAAAEAIAREAGVNDL